MSAAANAIREPRTPKQARSRLTRERVLDAAVECFESLGYDQTTTAQIARAATIGVGTLYGYFADKRAILLELLGQSVEQIAEAILAGLDPSRWQGRTAREGVRELISLAVNSQRFRPGFQRIMWERYFKDAEFRAHSEAIENRIRSALVLLLQTLRGEGRVRVSDDQTAAFVVHTAVQWMATRIDLGNAGVDADAAVDSASDMITRFLFRDAEGEHPMHADAGRV